MLFVIRGRGFSFWIHAVSTQLSAFPRQKSLYIEVYWFVIPRLVEDPDAVFGDRGIHVFLGIISLSL